ncbi:hypothetical protein NPX13_g5050 [Xylaria arbuscula]|uniref:Uncharacterized protein n=1 Tax=Xylaria arbuscula TaxID=114810 RepID=A0A9W8NFK1_9PEZI|nr:hypothetical protein NPX13_g5050 [Xylaria arbuscula]
MPSRHVPGQVPDLLFDTPGASVVAPSQPSKNARLQSTAPPVLKQVPGKVPGYPAEVPACTEGGNVPLSIEATNVLGDLPTDIGSATHLFLSNPRFFVHVTQRLSDA